MVDEPGDRGSGQYRQGVLEEARGFWLTDQVSRLEHATAHSGGGTKQLEQRP